VPLPKSKYKYKDLRVGDIITFTIHSGWNAQQLRGVLVTKGKPNGAKGYLGVQALESVYGCFRHYAIFTRSIEFVEKNLYV